MTLKEKDAKRTARLQSRWRNMSRQSDILIHHETNMLHTLQRYALTLYLFTYIAAKEHSMRSSLGFFFYSSVSLLKLKY